MVKGAWQCASPQTDYSELTCKLSIIFSIWVPSGRVMTGLLGSTWMMLTVPSGLLMVCTTVCEYCDGTFCEEGRHGQELGRRWRRLLGSGGWRSGMSETEATRR